MVRYRGHLRHARKHLLTGCRGSPAVQGKEEGRLSRGIQSGDYLFSPASVADTHSDLVQIIADATATAYKGSTQDVQLKIRRVVEVWRQRGIFETAIQDAVERRIDGWRAPFSSLIPVLCRLTHGTQKSTSRGPLVQQQELVLAAHSSVRPLCLRTSNPWSSRRQTSLEPRLLRVP